MAARAIAKTAAYATSRRERKRVEMLFAHLKRILKLDRLRLRGPNGAKDEFLLAATAAHNLRKLAKLIPLPAPIFAAYAAGGRVAAASAFPLYRGPTRIPARSPPRRGMAGICAYRPFIGPILKGSKGRFDPFVARRMTAICAFRPAGGDVNRSLRSLRKIRTIGVDFGLANVPRRPRN